MARVAAAWHDLGEQARMLAFTPVPEPHMTRGPCILAHGFESGPDATKVTALADVAGRG